MSRLFVQSDWVTPMIVAFSLGVLISLFNPAFLSTFNIQVLLEAVSINVLIALSQMVIIAIGQMNLSVGALGGLAAVIFAGLMEVFGIPPILAGALALGVGLVGGLLNGLLIGLTGISAFVITLATLSIFKGLNLAITQAQPFYEIPDAVKLFGNATLLGPFPIIFVPAALIVVLLVVFFNRLPVGRWLLAVGGNAHSAELSGISTIKTVVIAHCLSGVLAACAGVLLVARLQLGQPTIGDDWLIMSFAAPIIGGAILAGGHVSTVATVFGVLIVAQITQALVLFHIDPFFVQVVLGLMILAAVSVNQWRELRLQRAGQG
ncbi:ABC transporter permease [Marinovum sp. 2_MG-2023]|uniref:ABC transporter permease n=1 Tax=unclassified Marinovum TaxID=2647166 RepID=UPI0026E34BCF|nr:MULTISPECIES: ABC transporter permease [unclassified Marinovum]MDO6731850.1 ABC transporter permease [Marinovum sp. 2_MG-2023]MDO6781102.1 ABC transporter permease [Marinovum sp. 1_MG-2023]